MKLQRSEATAIGVGAAACVACCAGPIIGVLAALGLGTAAAVALFGTIGLAIGVIAFSVVVVGRSRPASSPAMPEPVAAERSESSAQRS